MEVKFEWILEILKIESHSGIVIFLVLLKQWFHRGLQRGAEGKRKYPD